MLKKVKKKDLLLLFFGRMERVAAKVVGRGRRRKDRSLDVSNGVAIVILDVDEGVIKNVGNRVLRKARDNDVVQIVQCV